MDDEPKPVAKPKQAARRVLGPAKQRPNVVIAPIIEEEAPEIDYTPVVKPKKVRSSKFIPDFDW